MLISSQWQSNRYPYMIFCYKNDKHEIIQCNDHAIRCAGLRNENQVIGKTDYEFPWSEYAEIYHQHETDILNGNVYSTLIPLKDHAGRKSIFLHNKYCEYDEHGKFTRMICYATELINPSIYNLELLLSKNQTEKYPSYGIEKKVPNISLTIRQQQILFFFLHGKNARKIAEILQISKHTVEEHIENIKDKLHCKTRAEIYSQALQLGFLTIIPSGIIIKKLVEGLKNE